jgi:multiple sugar transport system permease protein
MGLPLSRTAGTPRLQRRAQQWVEVLPFLLPGLLIFAIFILWPLVQGFRMSFYHWNIMPGAEQEFIGLANFRRVFADPIIRISMRNTLLYVVVSVPGQMFFGMLVALALNAQIRGKAIWRAIYYLPVLTSWVVVSFIFKYLFNGGGAPINYIFHDLLHVLPHYVNWFQDPWTAQVPIIILGVWKGIGWTMVMFLAGLQSIPKELYEAAAIDGANASKTLWNVTVPLLRSVVLFVTVMLTIGAFNVGLHILLLTQGGPMNQTTTIVSYMYDQGFKYFEFGYGSAIAVLLGILMFCVAMVQNRLLKGRTEM